MEAFHHKYPPFAKSAKDRAPPSSFVERCSGGNRNCELLTGRGIHENQVIPDDGDAEDEGVNAIEDATVAREKAAGVLHASAAFVGGFEEIAHLARDVADGGHNQEMRDRDANPETERV